MAQFPRTNGDLQPVVTFDSGVLGTSAPNVGWNSGVNAVADGQNVQPQGPKLEFFTIAAGGVVTAAEMAAAVQTVQQVATIYLYNASLATGDLIIGTYPVGAFAAAGLAQSSAAVPPGPFASATAYLDAVIQNLGGGWAAATTSTGATFA